MRRIIAILCVCLSLTGCGTRYAEGENDSAFGDGYFTMYHTQDDKVYVDWWITDKTNSIYFESEEKAQQAMDAVGVDRIKKYYLEVGE